MRLSFCRPVFALVTTSSDDTGSSTLVGTVYGLVVIMERGFGNSLFFLKRHYQPTSFVKSLPLMWWPLWLLWGYFGTTFSSLNVNAFPALSRPGATLQVMQWARGGGGEGCARRRRWMPLLSQPAKVRGSAETGSAASQRLVWAALLGPWCDLFGLRD